MIQYYVLKTIENAKKNITKHNIKTYDDVKNSTNLIIAWDDRFKKKDDAFVKDFLKPRFYEHYEIKRMDSRAEFFLNQVFKAFKKHPKQLPEYTHGLFIEAIKSHLSELAKNSEEKFSSDISSFLNNNNLKCEDTCSYLPKSKYHNDNQIENSFCPLLKFGKGACEGIRVIINHIAGMTDR
jgi:dGTP triphosphohydrolase